jgi:protein TBF1
LNFLFHQARLLFSKDSPRLSGVEDLAHIDDDERRICDLASLCCSITSSGPAADCPERHRLYGSFFSIILRDGAELSQRTADLFVAANTHAIIDSVARGVQEKPIDQIIEEALPSNLEQLLKDRRGAALDMTEVERSLVETAQLRKETLLSNIGSGQNEGTSMLPHVNCHEINPADPLRQASSGQHTQPETCFGT